MTVIISQPNSVHRLRADHLSLHRRSPSPLAPRHLKSTARDSGATRRRACKGCVMKVVRINVSAGLASSLFPPLTCWFLLTRSRCTFFFPSPDIYNAHIRRRRGSPPAPLSPLQNVIVHPGVSESVFVRPTSGPEFQALRHTAASARLPFSGWAHGAARQDARAGHTYTSSRVFAPPSPPWVRRDSLTVPLGCSDPPARLMLPPPQAFLAVLSLPRTNTPSG